MSDRRLVLLDDRLVGISRMTRWRIEQEPDFPTPIIIRGRKYYDDSELTAWEESRRRVTHKRRTAEAAPNALPDNETTPPR
jgi:predicted DNA-binding transcriptional regulator AlpA